MATIYRKTYPIPMPEGAEIILRNGKKFARWQNGRAKEGGVQTRVAEVLDDGRVMFVSDGWYVRYTNADGVMTREATGLRDKQAAEKFLADRLADVDKLKAGIITPDEKEIAVHSDQPLIEHIEAYLDHLSRKRVRGRKVSEMYRKNTRIRLKRIVKECGFKKLRDITRDKVEIWLDAAEAKNLSAATRNDYLISLSAFCAWAEKNRRISRNPLIGIGKADRSSDRRHQRRALTADEVAALLEATRLRPVAEIGRPSMRLPRDPSSPNESRRKRSSWTFEPLTAENFHLCYTAALERLTGQPARLKRLERLGRQRAMFYLLAVSTGLRRNELASLTVGQIHLETTPATPMPYIQLSAADAKNAREANLPLRPDVVEKLNEYLTDLHDRRGCRDRQADNGGHPTAHGGRRGASRNTTHGLKLDAKLFDNPPTIRIFDADIQAAGIKKKDNRNRVADIHALRYTFGTHLSAAGVHPRTTMAAMRHSRIELTMNLYTDPALLDIAGAVNSLPNFLAPPTTKPATKPDTDPGFAASPAA